MFFSVARSRPFIAFALLLPSFAQAHVNRLFTSTVSYCSPPESLLVEQLDIVYFQSNATVSFNVSAASVLPDVNVTANLFVNVYGMRPFNMTIDLCSLLQGALCPLPTYNFTGADSITLPPAVDVTHFLPEIAYKIPDLEAFVQLTLTEVNTGKVRACVQSTLSNGWSARQTGVEWATGGIAFLALASAVFYSYFRPDSLAPVRFLDVIYLFQSIAASALFGLNYPSVYRAYGLNFAWALGLFSQSDSSSIQQSIDNMRRLTGGTLADSGSGDSAISLVNRKLSPYNNPYGDWVIPDSLLARFAALPKVDLNTFIAGNGTLPTAPLTSQILVGGPDVATVTQGSSNTLEAGIPIYVSVLGIATENAFMSIFFVALILTAIVLFLLGAAYVVLRVVSRRTSWGQRKGLELEKAIARYPSFARAWLFRTAVVCGVPVFIFGFYQWTLGDSWLADLLAVFLILYILLSVSIPTLLIFRPPLISRYFRTREVEDPTQSPSLVPFTSPLRRERLYFIIALGVAILVKTLVVAFGQKHGMVQAIIVLISEVLLFGVFLVLKPYRTRGADFLWGTLAVVRIVCTGLLIAFSISLALSPIPRVAIGIVAAVIWSLAVVLMFFNILVNLGAWRFIKWVLPFRRNRSFVSEATLANENGSAPSLEPKGDAEKTTVTPVSSTYYRRPENPEPTHTPTTASAFSPVTTLSHFSDPPSAHSRVTSTTTTTLGETLPHRWSFQHSRPPSTSLASHGPITPVTMSGESVYTTPRQSWRQSDNPPPSS
ncbi:TRP-domain-containing protein [Phanerochaete sordida]|uniref:TRP-domain-containing protein n=1 Tax=Phanerochaete sordida TaxID=48140 RepID=A0A9P3GI29_9APHY|nr:TRP-domain-containing protein [Phanerochaete sordida]